MNIILFGFKKCGKTHYGLRAAQKLHMNFVDSDFLVEKIYAKHHIDALSYREIVKKHGFAFFRKLEDQAVSLLLNEKNTLIALGGGVVLNPDNVERLQQIGTFVYIKTPKEVLEERIFSDLPSYLDPLSPQESFNAFYQERLPSYEHIQALVLDTKGQDEEEILQTLCQMIQKVQHGQQ